MAGIEYLASAAVTGLFLFGVVAAILRLRRWRRYRPPAPPARRGSRVADATGRPGVWIAAFLGLALVFGGGTVVFVSGAGVPEEVSAGVGVALPLAAAALLVAYLFSGVYLSARSRGVPSAGAAAVGSWTVGLLLVAAVVVKLVTG